MIELRGDPSLGVTQISLKAMERVLKKEKNNGVLVELSQLQEDRKAEMNEPPAYL